MSALSAFLVPFVAFGVWSNVLCMQRGREDLTRVVYCVVLVAQVLLAGWWLCVWARRICLRAGTAARTKWSLTLAQSERVVLVLFAVMSALHLCFYLVTPLLAGWKVSYFEELRGRGFSSATNRDTVAAVDAELLILLHFACLNIHVNWDDIVVDWTAATRRCCGGCLPETSDEMADFGGEYAIDAVAALRRVQAGIPKPTASESNRRLAARKS